MKQISTILLLLLAVAASASVSCERTKAPVLTTGIENATPHVEAVVISGGAITHYPVVYLDCAFTEVLTIREIHWGVDEEFYRNGYKAKLGTAIEEIIAPPDFKSGLA